MKTLKHLCTPRESIFDVMKRYTVLNPSHLVADSIDPSSFSRRTSSRTGCVRCLSRRFAVLPASRSRPYLGSAEDRGHQLLSHRLLDIFNLFGQLPDALEDVWIRTATGEIEQAKTIIDAVPQKHPFDLRYERIAKTDWESCAEVLSDEAKRHVLTQLW